MLLNFFINWYTILLVNIPCVCHVSIQREPMATCSLDTHVWHPYIMLHTLAALWSLESFFALRL